MQRQTQQREAIRRAIEEADRPLSPQEILSSARRLSPRLGMATVYRNLGRLLDEGALRKVDLPGSPNRYERADKGHHHHFHCERCDRVFEVDDCPGGLGELVPAGFRPQDHLIIIYGLCSSCAEKK